MFPLKQLRVLNQSIKGDGETALASYAFQGKFPLLVVYCWKNSRKISQHEHNGQNNNEKSRVFLELQLLHPLHCLLWILLLPPEQCPDLSQDCVSAGLIIHSWGEMRSRITVLIREKDGFCKHSRYNHAIIKVVCKIYLLPCTIYSGQKTWKFS